MEENVYNSWCLLKKTRLWPTKQIALKSLIGHMQFEMEIYIHSTFFFFISQSGDNDVVN